MLTAGIKAVLLLSTALLVGSGMSRYLLAGTVPARWMLTTTVLAGLLLLAGSYADIVATLQSVFSRFDGELLGRYMVSTRHGSAIIWRTGLTVALVVLLCLPRHPVLGGLALLSSAALIVTFSVTSHAAAMAGAVPMIVDAVHFAAAAVWSGSLFHAAAANLWHESSRTALLKLMTQVSAIGLASVAVVVFTGFFSALVHTSEPATFVGSEYSWVLLAKILLVAVTIGIAAANRFVFLPRVRREEAVTSLRRAVTAEALLLITIFIATGMLTVSELPHSGAASTNVLENLSRLLNHFLE